MEDLIKEYRESLGKVNKARFTINDEHSKKLLGECASSLRYTVDYLELGKEPGNRRSITNRSKEQRTIPVDPNNYAFIKMAVIQRKTNSEGLSDEQRDLLDDLLALLTPREKEAFILVRGSGYSYSQAAEMLRIAKGTIEDRVQRAERKMRIIATRDIKSGEITVNKPLQCVIFA